MEPTGRESYGPAAERLDGYASGVSPDALAGLADELLAVGGLFAREPGLRRALADPARSPEDRVGLLRAVLSGKVGDEALGLLEALVGERWSRPNALRDAVERLGVDALLAGADRAVNAERVQFHQLAGIVLVDVALALLCRLWRWRRSRCRL